MEPPTGKKLPIATKIGSESPRADETWVKVIHLESALKPAIGIEQVFLECESTQSI
jgi:hypothetical protein